MKKLLIPLLFLTLLSLKSHAIVIGKDIQILFTGTDVNAQLDASNYVEDQTVISGGPEWTIILGGGKFLQIDMSDSEITVNYIAPTDADFSFGTDVKLVITDLNPGSASGVDNFQSFVFGSEQGMAPGLNSTSLYSYADESLTLDLSNRQISKGGNFTLLFTVPEPATLVLMSVPFTACYFTRRQRKKRFKETGGN